MEASCPNWLVNPLRLKQVTNDFQESHTHRRRIVFTMGISSRQDQLSMQWNGKQYRIIDIMKVG